MAIKKINVNGTDYDISMPGVEIPIVCENCAVADNGDPYPPSEFLEEHPGAAYSTTAFESSVSFAIKRTGESGAYQYSIAILADLDNIRDVFSQIESE